MRKSDRATLLLRVRSLYNYWKRSGRNPALICTALLFHFDSPDELQRFQQQIQESSDREEIKILDEKMSACIRLLADHATPFLVLATQAPNAEKAFDNAYAPEGMEKILRLEAALDARIARILARLVGLKEYKRTPAGGGSGHVLEISPHA